MSRKERANSILDWPNLVAAAVLAYLATNIPPLSRLWNYLKRLSPRTKLLLVATLITSAGGQGPPAIWVALHGPGAMLSLTALELGAGGVVISSFLATGVMERLSRRYGIDP